jgi:hypothetical protein
MEEIRIILASLFLRKFKLLGMFSLKPIIQSPSAYLPSSDELSADYQVFPFCRILFFNIFITTTPEIN